MKRILSIRPEAEQDLREALQWYETRRPGLGEDLILCVDASLKNLQENPQLFPTVLGEIRRCLVRRFPYAIFYIFNDKIINVIAFFHCNRNPKSWKDRSKVKY